MSIAGLGPDALSRGVKNQEAPTSSTYSNPPSENGIKHTMKRTGRLFGRRSGSAQIKNELSLNHSQSHAPSPNPNAQSQYNEARSSETGQSTQQVMWPAPQAPSAQGQFFNRADATLDPVNENNRHQSSLVQSYGSLTNQEVDAAYGNHIPARNHSASGEIKVNVNLSYQHSPTVIDTRNAHMMRSLQSDPIRFTTASKLPGEAPHASTPNLQILDSSTSSDQVRSSHNQTNPSFRDAGSRTPGPNSQPMSSKNNMLENSKDSGRMAHQNFQHPSIFSLRPDGQGRGIPISMIIDGYQKTARISKSTPSSPRLRQATGAVQNRMQFSPAEAVPQASMPKASLRFISEDNLNEPRISTKPTTMGEGIENSLKFKPLPTSKHSASPQIEISTDESTPRESSYLSKSPDRPTPSSKEAFSRSSILGRSTMAPSTPTENIYVMNKASSPIRVTVEDRRRAKIQNFDSAAFDAMIYQQADSRPPQDVIIPSILHTNRPVSTSEDERLYLHTNPYIHRLHNKSEEWHKQKAIEIQTRGGRKAWFGKVLERERWLREKEIAEAQQKAFASTSELTPHEQKPWSYNRILDFGDVPPESLPEDVLQNPAWVRACAWHRENHAKSIFRDQAAKDRHQEALDHAKFLLENAKNKAKRKRHEESNP